MKTHPSLFSLCYVAFVGITCRSDTATSLSRSLRHLCRHHVSWTHSKVAGPARSATQSSISLPDEPGITSVGMQSAPRQLHYAFPNLTDDEYLHTESLASNTDKAGDVQSICWPRASHRWAIFVLQINRHAERYDRVARCRQCTTARSTHSGAGHYSVNQAARRQAHRGPALSRENSSRLSTYKRQNGVSYAHPQCHPPCLGSH